MRDTASKSAGIFSATCNSPDNRKYVHSSDVPEDKGGLCYVCSAKDMNNCIDYRSQKPVTVSLFYA